MKSRNTSYKVVASFVLGSVAAGSCFAQFLDRNFQRFDRSGTAKFFTLAPMNESESWLEGAFSLTLPNSVKAYSGSLTYVQRPFGAGEGLRSFSATATVTHTNPSGGPNNDIYSGTFQYQLLEDKAGGLTLGFFTSAFAGGVTTYAPSLSINSVSQKDSDPTFTPTVTWVRLNAGSAHADGFVGDLQLQVPATSSLGYALDYVFPSRIAGPSAFQLDAKYRLSTSKADNKKSGETNLEAAMNVSEAFNPSYVIRFSYKF